MIFEFMHTEAQRSEISEMLLQEGLADIIPISLSEQVAYLLADRASLLEKTQSQENVDGKTAQEPDVCKEQTSKECRENVVKVRESVLRFCLTICQVKCIYIFIFKIHIVSKQLHKQSHLNINILMPCSCI